MILWLLLQAYTVNDHLGMGCKNALELLGSCDERVDGATCRLRLQWQSSTRPGKN